MGLLFLIASHFAPDSYDRRIRPGSSETGPSGWASPAPESLQSALKKNRKKLAVDPARREPGETLKAEFEGSMKKLLPLRERIEKTDRLIE